MKAQTGSGHGRPSPAAILFIVPVAVAIVLTLFAWPNARLEPRDLPIGVAGPAAGPLEHKLAEKGGAFDLHRYAGEAAAREAIEDREVYGAFVMTQAGPKVLSASGASSGVAQLLTRAAGEIELPKGAAPVEVEDVAPAPRGAALASSVLPLVIAGLLTGALAALLGSGVLQRAALVVGGSVLAGLVATGIVQTWLDVVDGSWLANAGALSLTVLAIASIMVGLHAALGERGLVLGLLAMVFVANPFSGVGSAPELLPQPVGGLGQLMPAGAGGNLLRSTGFFDGAAAGGHIAVLLAWTVTGLALLLVQPRGRRASGVPAATATT